MQISQYIIVKGRKRGYYRSFTSRLSKTTPKLDSDEVAVKVTIELPDAIFEKPMLEAKVVVPEGAVSRPVITAETVDNVEQIIKTTTGFNVKLEVVEEDKADEE